MSIPNAGPDIPYVTTVPTSYIGPSVSVAGVLWVWKNGYRRVTTSNFNSAWIHIPWKATASVVSANLAANNTYAELVEAPEDCYGVEVVFINKLRTPVPVLESTVVTVASIASAAGATTGNPVTVSGSGAFNLPASPGSESTSSTEPPGVLVSDPVFFSPVANASGKTLILLRVAYGATAGYASSYPSSQNLGIGACSFAQASGNTVNSAMSASQFNSNAGTLLGIAGFVFLCKSGTKNVSCFGDSLLEGVSSGGSGYIGGWIDQACKAVGVPLAKWAAAGQTQVKRGATIDAILASGLSRYDLTFMEAWTTNDSISVDAAWGRGMYDYQRLKDAGANPVIILNPPRDTNPGTILTLNSRIRNSGLPYFDAFSPLGNADGTYIAGYSDDGVHPNVLGHSVLSPFAEKFIRDW